MLDIAHALQPQELVREMCNAMRWDRCHLGLFEGKLEQALR